jgi:hypothetical protein
LTVNWRAVTSIILGFYFVIDGIISFLLYLDQTWYEQLFRVIRTIGGILVVLLAPPTGIGLPRGAISHLLRILRKSQLGDHLA